MDDDRPGTPFDWGDSTESYSQDLAESRALCRSVRIRKPPAADIPDASARSGLKGCDAEALYYGIGMKADPVRARQCAFVEMETGEETIFGGRVMLMTAYANGVGARRDLDLAIHYACTLEPAAPFEYDGRVLHLAKMKQEASPDPFHFCDDTTSGYAGGLCAMHQARLEQARREARLTRLAARFPTRSRALFTALRKTQDNYADSRGENETDFRGTLRVAFAVEAEEAVADEFLDTLERLSKGTLRSYTNSAFRKADARLNQRYRQLLDSEALEDMGLGKDGVRRAQRAWLAYRDAFIAFAAVAFPAVSRDSIAGNLTDQRAGTLKEMAEL